MQDGEPTFGSVSQSALLTLLNTKQTQLQSSRGRQAVWFTYSLGRTASQTIPKAFACATDGIWAAIVEGQGDSLRAQMGHYYDYFASLRASGTTDVIWVEPYEDANGAGQVRLHVH